MSDFANGWTKETVIKHLKDNFKGISLNGSGICRYKTTNGARCAIGLFLPNKHEYNQFIGGVIRLIFFHPDVNNFLPFHDSDVLVAFQKVHDDLATDGENDDNVLSELIRFVEERK